MEEVTSLPGEGVAGTQFSYDGIGYVLSGDGEDHRSMETGNFGLTILLLIHGKMDCRTPVDPVGAASFIIDGEYLINGTSFGRYVSENYKFDLKAFPIGSRAC